MVVINQKYRGSYTVEGTIIVSFLCLIIGFVIVLGFYGHDRAVIMDTANELSMMASLWTGRYVYPSTCEVDYEALKRESGVDLNKLENIGSQMLQSRLLYGEIKSVDVFRTTWKKSVCVEISVKFKIWSYEFEYKTEATCPIVESSDLPRGNTGSKEDE